MCGRCRAVHIGKWKCSDLSKERLFLFLIRKRLLCNGTFSEAVSWLRWVSAIPFRAPLFSSSLCAHFWSLLVCGAHVIRTRVFRGRISPLNARRLPGAELQPIRVYHPHREACSAFLSVSRRVLVSSQNQSRWAGCWYQAHVVFLQRCDGQCVGLRWKESGNPSDLDESERRRRPPRQIDRQTDRQRQRHQRHNRYRRSADSNPHQMGLKKLNSAIDRSKMQFVS